jgi:CRP-like cAMP-binding protein
MNIIEKALQGNKFFSKKDLFLVEKLASFLFSKKINKKELLLQEGEINDRMFYVQKGLLRVYFINEDGKEIKVGTSKQMWDEYKVGDKAEKKSGELWQKKIE